MAPGHGRVLSTLLLLAAPSSTSNAARTAPGGRLAIEVEPLDGVTDAEHTR